MMTDRVIFICTIVVAVVYLYATTLIPTIETGDPLGPKAYPRVLGVALLIAAGLLFLEMRKDSKQEDKDQDKNQGEGRTLWVIAGVTAWSAGYYAVFEKLGYVLATTVYLLALMAWFHRGKWLANGLTAVLFSALSYLMFLKLEVNLPKGILPF
jgi:putative tricarboxylic transport membrane protein